MSVRQRLAGRVGGLLLACMLLALSGCAVFTVADAAVSVAATTVKIGAKVVGAGVDLVLPDDDEEDEE